MAVDTDKARRGLMKFIDKKGGSVPMGELHTHSTVFYQAGHQAFSELMEGLVTDQLVVFDEGTFAITDKGRASISE